MGGDPPFASKDVLGSHLHLERSATPKSYNVVVITRSRSQEGIRKDRLADLYVVHNVDLTTLSTETGNLLLLVFGRLAPRSLELNKNDTTALNKNAVWRTVPPNPLQFSHQPATALCVIADLPFDVTLKHWQHNFNVTF